MFGRNDNFGRLQLSLKTKLSKRDLRNFLFSEELGFVMQVSKETFKEIEAFMKVIKTKDKLTILGSTDKTNGLTISSREFEETIDLKALITNWTCINKKLNAEETIQYLL